VRVHGTRPRIEELFASGKGDAGRVDSRKVFAFYGIG
jgi:hypothetical protein